ncbi:MAG: hypothetical protein WC882_05900 [Candidatus Gracilibacteria bacterium]
MKKFIVFGAILSIALLTFAGCGSSVVTTPSTPTPTTNTTTTPTTTTTTTTSDDDIPPPSDNPADYLTNPYGFPQEMIDAEMQYELDEFEQTDAIDPPAGFPLGFLYANGKVVGMSNDGDEYYINKSVTIKTTDDSKTVKAFYKNILVAPWEITSQSSDGSNTYYYATHSETGMEIDVSIYADSYSKLVEIDVYYSGYPQ